MIGYNVNAAKHGFMLYVLVQKRKYLSFVDDVYNSKKSKHVIECGFFTSCSEVHRKKKTKKNRKCDGYL